MFERIVGVFGRSSVYGEPDFPQLRVVLGEIDEYVVCGPAETDPHAAYGVVLRCGVRGLPARLCGEECGELRPDRGRGFDPDRGDSVSGDADRETAVGELARYRKALDEGDQATIDEVTAKFDPATPQGEEFLREYFAYFGYGYLDAPQDIVPDVPLLFYSFRVMVGAGCFFILLLGVVWWLNRKDRLADKRWLLWIAVWSVPLAYLASQAGWVLAEVGRQPWAIQDLMPVGIAASKIGSTSVTATFFIFLALFTALLIAELSILFRQIKIGPEQEKE